MSLVTQMYLLERYGVRLSIEQLAEILGMSRGALFNRLAKGECPIATYLDGGRRYADYRDVASYFDACRARAKAEHEDA